MNELFYVSAALTLKIGREFPHPQPSGRAGCSLRDWLPFSAPSAFAAWTPSSLGRPGRWLLAGLGPWGALRGDRAGRDGAYFSDPLQPGCNADNHIVTNGRVSFFFMAE